MKAQDLELTAQRSAIRESRGHERWPLAETMAEDYKLYRLIISGERNQYEIVGFSAPSIASALWLARSYCGEGAGELFENGRRLGSGNGACAEFIPFHLR